MYAIEFELGQLNEKLWPEYIPWRIAQFEAIERYFTGQRTNVWGQKTARVAREHLHVYLNRFRKPIVSG